ncbi:MAG: hypothetical protein Q8L14_39990 [Myxococcales bacterium]|nr:hypothetical protein [Myxococcales bacterium]
MSLSIGSGSSSVSSASRELEADITPPPAPEVLPQPITPIVDHTTSGFDDVTRPITCAGPSSSTFDTTPITCAGPATTATPPPVSGPEAAEWPGGNPAAREKSRIEQTALEVPASEKLETLVSALPADVGAEVAKLVNTPPGVTAESLDASYRSVLDARATPGSKQLELSLTPLMSQTTNIGEGETVTSLVAGDAKTFTAALEVGADGKVNGKTLGVDELARLGSQLSTVPVEVKEKALLDAGLSADWVRNSTEGQRDYALAKLRQESATPGSRELDLTFSYTVRQGGDAEYTTTHTAPGVLKLDVGADGTVNGKTPLVEVALATQLTMERMSMADKRAMLAQVGFPPEACSAIRPDEAASILTQVSFATREPGEHSLFVKVDGEAWQLGLKIGEKGAIEGAGAQKVPPDPPFWKQIVGPVLMVVGVVFPVLAPFTMALNAAMAVANGAKGLGLVAAIAGAAAGIGGMVSQFAGVASSVGQSATAFVSVAKTVASVASAANGVQQAIKTGDILGGISSVASLAGQFDGVRDALGSNLDLLQKAGQAAGFTSRIIQGDLVGIGADLIAGAAHGDRATTATQADVRRVDNAIDAENADATSTDFGLGTARLGESGTSTVRLGTGDDGASVDTSTPRGTQADVRRIDNALDTSPWNTQRVTVARGDNLSRIASAQLGDASLAPEVYAWNAAKIGANPNLIGAGVELEMPPSGFRLTDQERDAFFRTTHLPPANEYAFSDNRDTRDLRGGGQPVVTTGGTTTTATGTTSPASTRTTPMPGGELGPNTVSSEWGGVDPNVGTYNGLETLRPGDSPAFLAGAKLKFELQAGTWKGEIAVGPEVGVSAKASNEALSTKAVGVRIGAVKFVGEPSISVKADGTWSVEGKVQASAGVVSLNLKGVMDEHGNYKLDAPTLGYKTDWLGAEFQVPGLSIGLTLETGGLFRWVGDNKGAEATSPFYREDGGGFAP